MKEDYDIDVKRSDAVFSHHKEQQLASIMDDLHKADEYLVFTRKIGQKGCTIEALIFDENKSPWAESLRLQADTLED